jgi:hypothetical protein
MLKVNVTPEYTRHFEPFPFLCSEILVEIVTKFSMKFSNEGFCMISQSSRVALLNVRRLRAHSFHRMSGVSRTTVLVGVLNKEVVSPAQIYCALFR